MPKKLYSINRKSIFPLLILCLLFSGGCWDRHELNSLAIVSGLAIDISKTGEEISLTTQIIDPAKIKSPQGGGGEGSPYWNISSSGKTVFDAVKRATHQSPNKLLMSHSDVVIFGEELAREGIAENLDILARDFELRTGIWMAVAEGRGSEILNTETTLETIPAFSISRSIKNQINTSHSLGIDYHNFLLRTMSEATAPIASLIKISNSDGEKTLSVSGMAVFNRDLKLVGKLNSEECRGLLWVLGKVNSGIINVDTPDCNAKASLEIQKASSSIVPEFNGDKVRIIIKIQEESNLAEFTCSKGLLSASKWDSLNRSQAAVIKSEVMRSVAKARQLNTDIFGFGDVIYKKNPRKWEELKPVWEEIFPKLEVKVMVESKIRRSGMTQNAIKFH